MVMLSYIKSNHAKFRLESCYRYCAFSWCWPLSATTWSARMTVSIAKAMRKSLSDVNVIYVSAEPLNKWIKAFSARSNCRILFRLVAPRSNPNVIDCLHGIRVLSFIWVVYGHIYLVSVFGPNMNLVKLDTVSSPNFPNSKKSISNDVHTFSRCSGADRRTVC